MNIKTFIAWAVLSALVGCATTPPDESVKVEELPTTTYAGIPGGVQLFWNASPSANVGGYKVSYGQNSGNYTSTLDAGNVTTASVTGLTEGTKYYFAVKAYDSTRTVESPYSNEIIYTMPVTAAVPTANFTASPTSGNASLAVNFTPVTTGTVTSWKWDFPGSYTPSVTNTTAKVTTATYATPGTYSATLTVTGPGGTATKSAPNLINVTTATVPEPTPTPTPTPTPPPPGVAESSKLGLVAAYGFEEPSGTRVVDASGKGNHGTITKATRAITNTPAVNNKRGLVFNGVDAWVTVKDSASLDLSAGLTLEAWVYPTVSMTNKWATVAMKEQTGGQVYTLYANTDRNQPGLITWINGEQYVTGGTPLMPNQWWHVVATYDGQYQTLYVNGIQVAKRAQTGAIQTSSGALRIGGNSIWPGEFFKGVIDELRIYNRALTAEEVSYNKTNSVSATNPPQLVLGNTTVEPTWDDIAQGTAIAYRTSAPKSGVVTAVDVYVADGSTATELVAGIYKDYNGHPSTLVAQGKLTTLKAGTWNSVPIPVVSVAAGTRYWIGLLGSKGVIAYRDRMGSGTEVLETSASRTLTSLPTTWSRANYWTNSNVSAAGLGYVNQ